MPTVPPDPLDSLRAWVEALIDQKIKDALGTGGEFLSTGEAATMMRITPATLRRWVKEGRLTPLVAGRELRFRRADLDSVMTPSGRARAPGPRVTRKLTVEQLVDVAWSQRKKAS